MRGILISDILQFRYRWLSEERQVWAVANLTHQDAAEFLALAPKAQVHTTTTSYALAEANEALDDLRTGRFQARRCARALTQRMCSQRSRSSS